MLGQAKLKDKSVVVYWVCLSCSFQSALSSKQENKQRQERMQELTLGLNNKKSSKKLLSANREITFLTFLID